MRGPGRNDPCPCGSGKKFKHCCLSVTPAAPPAPRERAAPVADMLARAMSHFRAGDLDAAAGLYREILTRDPGVSEAWYLLGSCRQQQERSDEAVACFTEVLKLSPDNAGAHHNLGFEFIRQNRLDEAVAALERALALLPSFAEARYLLAYARLLTGHHDEAIRACRRALADKPGYSHACDTLLFAMLYRDGTSPGELFAAHRDYAARFEAALAPRLPGHRNAPDPDRRLRIGYLSPDLHYHSIAFFLEPLLDRHDRERFETWCYSSGAHDDAVSGRLAAAATRWVPCAGIGDEALAARIEADGIDILVDLAGHSANNRLLVFARKPAPVQVTWLGYPETTGLSAIDWRITTAEVDPSGNEEWHSERLWRLPRSLWCYRPPAEVDRFVPPLPAAGTGRITFGAMNHFSKVTVAMLELWASILQETGDACLLMTNVPAGASQARIRAFFADRGIAPARLLIHGRLPFPDYHTHVDEVDIALDTFPYNGTTTTCEALWKGIPVVTRVGATSVARSGHALLDLVGLGELCAEDAPGYVRRAVDLARDPARLRALRSGLRARMTASPLRDEAGFTREIEEAYRGMWRQWCQREGRG